MAEKTIEKVVIVLNNGLNQLIDFSSKATPREHFQVGPDFIAWARVMTSVHYDKSDSKSTTQITTYEKFFIPMSSIAMYSVIEMEVTDA